MAPRRLNHFFMPLPLSVRCRLKSHMKNSKTTIWAMSLGAKLFRPLSENPHGTMVLSNPQQSSAAGRLLTQLEIAFLKFMSVGIIPGYIVLQKALPGFLSMIAAGPGLCIEHPNGSLVASFAHTFGTSRYEIGRFVMYDIATSLVLGVPPLVEYGYDGECDPTSYDLEWLHGIPVPLVETISQVNSWRGGSRVAPLNDWQNLEQRILAWQPRPIIAETEDYSTRNMERLAIREGWSKPDQSVGIGAQCEQHRSIVRKKLDSIRGSQVWIFRGPEFVRILEHLWHNAGAGGAAVTWEDYVRSRRTMAPL
ncbi:hypothetical protein B0J17DRAFT_756674 [Rhizoctonia solani]|nr:hypothetical protein B0J17DRAFT_756674 [Rhizoctonia solani]